MRAHFGTKLNRAVLGKRYLLISHTSCCVKQSVRSRKTSRLLTYPRFLKQEPDITEWYMTLVMDPNRSIYPITPERPRDLSARAPGPACQEYYNIITRPHICLGKKLSKTINP